MMHYNQFLDVPAELKVKIIQKCYPVPYSRLRRSCHFVDEFCEQNRKQLGIYCCGVIKDAKIEEDVDGKSCYLSVNYGKRRDHREFALPMTKENIPRIRRALSGFAFTHFEARWRGEGSEEAIENFFEFAGDFRMKDVMLWYAPPGQIQRVLNIWNIEHLNLFWIKTDIRQLIYSTKKVSAITYWSGVHELNDMEIAEMARGRNSLIIWHGLECYYIVWKALDSIFAGWTKTVDAPETVEMHMILNRGVGEVDIYKGNTVTLPSHSLNFGMFPLEDKGECELWIIKATNGDCWRMLSIYSNSTRGGFYVQTAHTREQLAVLLINFITYELFYQRPYDRTCVLDYSTIFNRLQDAKSLEDVREEFIKFYHFVIAV